MVRPSTSCSQPAAEDAITQAETQLEGIARRESELADAAEKVPAARAAVELDLAEAQAMAGDVIAPVVAWAEAALAAADEAAGGSRPDPIAALRLLGEAGTALDQGIADARAAAADDSWPPGAGPVSARARTRLSKARKPRWW
jgi:hypothetical protein